MPDAEDLTIDGGQAGDSQLDAVRQFTARFRQAATISNATGPARAAWCAAGVRGLRVHGYCWWCCDASRRRREIFFFRFADLLLPVSECFAKEKIVSAVQFAN